jgi:hypothetical protein
MHRVWSGGAMLAASQDVGMSALDVALQNNPKGSVPAHYAKRMRLSNYAWI